jgi:hypothetical protein
MRSDSTHQFSTNGVMRPSPEYTVLNIHEMAAWCHWFKKIVAGVDGLVHADQIQ